MINTVISDIGGVCITPSEKITPHIIAELFHIPIDKAMSEYQEALPDLRIGVKSVLDLAKHINTRYKLTADLSGIEDAYSRVYIKQAVVNEDVVELFESLAGRCKRIACSNMLDIHVRCNRQRGLFRIFDAVYLSSVVGFAKPDRKMYEFVLTDMHVNAGNCLVIDDKDENITVARELGMRACLFESADQLLGLLQKEGVL